MTSRQQRYQQRHLAAGLCRSCGQPAVTKKHCQYHRSKKRQENARYKEKPPS